MKGSREELRYNERDLATLDAAMRYVVMRDVAVQAGGCLGVFAKYLAKRFAAVYSFEPSPVLFRTMCENLGDSANVITMQAALGFTRGPVGVELVLPDGKRVLHEGMTRTVPSGIIPTLRLDDLELPRCSLLCLDVEGDEIEALMGAQVTIRRHRPVIICEVNHALVSKGRTADDLRTFLRSTCNYDLIERRHSDEIFTPAERKIPKCL